MRRGPARLLLAALAFACGSSRPGPVFPRDVSGFRFGETEAAAIGTCRQRGAEWHAGPAGFSEGGQCEDARRHELLSVGVRDGRVIGVSRSVGAGDTGDDVAAIVCAAYSELVDRFGAPGVRGGLASGCGGECAPPACAAPADRDGTLARWTPDGGAIRIVVSQDPGCLGGTGLSVSVEYQLSR